MISPTAKPVQGPGSKCRSSCFISAMERGDYLNFPKVENPLKRVLCQGNLAHAVLFIAGKAVLPVSRRQVFIPRQ